jgi:hypothetical protein
LFERLKPALLSAVHPEAEVRFRGTTSGGTEDVLQREAAQTVAAQEQQRGAIANACRSNRKPAIDATSDDAA